MIMIAFTANNMQTADCICYFLLISLARTQGYKYRTQGYKNTLAHNTLQDTI